MFKCFYSECCFLPPKWIILRKGSLFRKALYPFCLTVGNTDLAPSPRLEAQAWSNQYRNSVPMPASMPGTKVRTRQWAGLQGGWILSIPGNISRQKGSLQVSISEVHEAPHDGGKQKGRGSKQPHDRDISELFLQMQKIDLWWNAQVLNGALTRH